MELYIAKSYGGWQASVLRYLQSKFDSTTGSFAANTIGEGITNAVKSDGTAADIPEKSLKGLCIPFARTKSDEAVLSGAEVNSLPFPSCNLVRLQQLCSPMPALAGQKSMMRC